MRGTLFLEAALIHQRCLIEFLVGRVNRKGARSWKERSDVTPAALCDGWEPEAALGAAHGDLTAALADIDSLLAHVSRRRAELVGRTWNLGSWTLAVFAALDMFVSWLRTVEPFRADCLQAWTGTAREHLGAAGVDLSEPLVVTPASSVMFVVPIGESAGRAAALMARAAQQ